ncbi:metallophosphoesterase family protein [Caldiplasma sukawensis]
MKFLVTSDIHGQKKVASFILKVAQTYEFDVIIIGGDIAGWKDHDSVFTVFDMLKDFTGITICVPGNSDLPDYIDISKNYENIIMLHGTDKKFKNVIFSGTGGMQTGTDHGSFFSLSENQLYNLSMMAMKKENGCYNISISHVPPYGVLDYTRNGDHAGSVGILRFIRNASPEVHVCGHIHENPGISLIGNTQVVNPGNMKVNDKIFYIRVEKGIHAGYIKYGEYDKLKEI